MLALLTVARDRISETDYQTFLWEDSELSLQLVSNHVRFGDSVTEHFDQAVIPFVMKLRLLCDRLDRYIV